jgi:hypothetical protein
MVRRKVIQSRSTEKFGYDWQTWSAAYRLRRRFVNLEQIFVLD